MENIEHEGEKLRRALNGLGIERKEQAKRLKMTTQNLNHHFRQQKVSKNFQRLVREVFPDIFHDGKEIRAPIKILEDRPAISYDNAGGVPFYDIDVTASLVSSFSDIREDPAFYVNFKPFNNCIAWVSVYGDSMYPKLQSGESVALKQVLNYESIQWGEAHLVITDSNFDLKVIKTVNYNEKDPETVILRSTNPNYKGETKIPLTSIVSLYIVKGKVTRFQL